MKRPLRERKTAKKVATAADSLNEEVLECTA